jgi:hypothetical protein
MLEKLIKIQSELKCPKNQYNSFGGFKYRSCEDILETVKPILSKYNMLLVINDEIVQVSDRVYVKATATIYDAETGKSISTCAFAREALAKTKQDDAQITGTASSYARKYALNGLFLIDDAKDADTDEYHEQTAVKLEPSKVKEITDLVQMTGSDLCKMLAFYKVKAIDDMTVEQAKKCIAQLKSKLK